MVRDSRTIKETALEAENADLRDLLTQAGIDAARLLAKAGIDATENEAAKRLQHLLLEELHPFHAPTSLDLRGILEPIMKVKDLIALLQKEDPEALVIKYNDGGTTMTSSVERLSPVPIKLPRGAQDQAAILIE